MLRWIGAALIAVACSFAPAAQASGEAFVHRGWKGYVLRDEPLGGCRMAYRVARDLHAIAHVTNSGQFLLGMVSIGWNWPVGRPIDGTARFDRSAALRISGSADNPQLVSLAGPSGYNGMEDQFRRGRRMVLTLDNGAWIDIGLTGSDRATDLLRDCALRHRTPPSPPVVSYAPSRSATPAGLRPPSFDCSYAGRASEFAICADPVLGDLDARMADLHAIARRGARDPGRFDRANESWRAGRDACGASVACIEDSYRSRIGELGVMAGIY